jgi:hypothetical protein
MIEALCQEINGMKSAGLKIAVYCKAYAVKDVRVVAIPLQGHRFIKVLRRGDERFLRRSRRILRRSSNEPTGARFGVQYSRIYARQIATNLGLGHRLSKSSR